MLYEHLVWTIHRHLVNSPGALGNAATAAPRAAAALKEKKMTAKLTMGRMEWALLLLLSVLWGGSFFFAKFALGEFPPLTLVLLRVVIAALALGTYLVVTRQTFRAPKSLMLTFAGMGLLNNLIPFSLLFFGQTEIGAGLASIFNALVPVFTVLVAHQFTEDEKLTSSKVAGVGLGVFGVIVLIGLDVKKGVDTWTILAMFACIGAALSYGLASVYGRRFTKMGVTPVQVAFGQIAATSVMMIPVALLVERPLSLPAPGLHSWLAVICLALFCTAFAYVLFFRILATAGATAISLVTFLIPISAIALGTLFLDEKLAYNHLLGILLIFAGLAALNDALGKRIRNLFGRNKSTTDCCSPLALSRK